MPFTAPKYRVLQPCCRRVKPFTSKIFFKKGKKFIYFFTKICCNSEGLCSFKSKSRLVWYSVGKTALKSPGIWTKCEKVFFSDCPVEGDIA